jgi:hypothetical protein
MKLGTLIRTAVVASSIALFVPVGARTQPATGGCLGPSCCSGPSCGTGAAIAPPAATYGSYDYVDSAVGSACVQKTGELFSGHLNWPGAGKTGAVWRYQIEPPASTGPEVEDISFPATPQATSTTWSGTEKHVILPSGETTTSSFEATLTTSMPTPSSWRGRSTLRIAPRRFFRLLHTSNSRMN